MKKGFTLIELLVVISIIGILVAVAVASYTGAQIKARDARRRSDMKAVQSTMEQYYATTGAGNYAALGTVFPTGTSPSDPKPSWTQYSVNPASPTTTYCACAKLEETGKGNASNASCTWTGTLNYFCVQNQQ